MTSGGNRNPANPETGGWMDRMRRRRFAPTAAFTHVRGTNPNGSRQVRAQCNSASRPNRPACDLEGDHRPWDRDGFILGVLDRQGVLGALFFGCRSNDSRRTVKTHPPQMCPVLVIMVNEQTSRWIRLDVLKPAQLQSRLRLCIDGRVHDLIDKREANGDEMRPPVECDRAQPSYPSFMHPLLGKQEVHALIFTD